ncbi:hypothetical protein C1637_09970 [Chryseobacterium lactis]|uniref:Uncharacterized protein n=1 Tax=Chryseobacterium lactis TaxID=1241981 RepID=A0A3G6RF45_CHRLC|nr:hypothetical protein [Chryseobacterium lactis]AZA82162.1 hypothetical protein EG342_09725 [Chryseobacterium lactis]AZB02543.1 hypothetical protein EG341_00580 [Chryseobacterium lactis]PNW14161.1 hypothetical protein C1637_09970 [Chryseobacterium lactis]
MLCVTLKSYTVPCTATTGGVSDLFIFDPSDFNWTQDETTKSYTALALREGATVVGGAKMHLLKFQRKEAEFKFKHTLNGCSVKYEYDLDAQLPNLSQELTNYLSSLDAAGCCCGLGMVIRLYSGKIFVIGERYVNEKTIPYFEVVMNGTEGGSGRKMEDFNGAKVMFKAEYGRMANEFSGDISVIEAFQ